MLGRGMRGERPSGSAGGSAPRTARFRAFEISFRRGVCMSCGARARSARVSQRRQPLRQLLPPHLYQDCHIFLWTLFDSLCMLVGYACSFFNLKAKRMSFMNFGVMSLFFAICLAIIGLLCVCKNSRAFISKSL